MLMKKSQNIYLKHIYKTKIIIIEFIKKTFFFNFYYKLKNTLKEDSLLI